MIGPLDPGGTGLGPIEHTARSNFDARMDMCVESFEAMVRSLEAGQWIKIERVDGPFGQLFTVSYQQGTHPEAFPGVKRKEP